MDSSFFSLIIFTIITILFFMFMPYPSIEMLQNADLYAGYTKFKMYGLAIYFAFIVLSQFGINAKVIMDKCGGSVTQNIQTAALMTFIPWLFVFGGLIAVLIIFPGFKSAFSNVIGYFAVSSRANDILTTLLVNTNINKLIDKATGTSNNVPESRSVITPSLPDNASYNTYDGFKHTPIKGGGPQDLKSAAEAIIKLCGNMSILINQIVPENFMEYWAMLTPLMKDEYKVADSPKTLDLQKQLLDVVVLRDNIGEALWYIYTAILLTSIIQYNIVKRGCTKDLATMEASHQQFLAQEEKDQAEKEKTQSMIYTTTN